MAGVGKRLPVGGEYGLPFFNIAFSVWLCGNCVCCSVDILYCRQHWVQSSSTRQASMSTQPHHVSGSRMGTGG